MNDHLTSYEELAEVIVSLPILFREKRRRKNLSLRDAAKQLDCSFSTVRRIESNEDYNSRILPKLLIWLGDYESN